MIPAQILVTRRKCFCAERNTLRSWSHSRSRRWPSVGFRDKCCRFSANGCGGIQWLERVLHRASLEHAGDMLRHGSILIGKTPGQDDGSVEDKPAHRRPSLIRSLILSPRKDSLWRLPKLASRSAASAAEPSWADMRSFSSAPSSRETLVSRRAASMRAHWATSSSRVTVTLRKRRVDDTNPV
jgi:hypothetical protein